MFETDSPEDLDENKKFKKWRLMWKRIAKHYPDGMKSVLDIGAGQGWAIEFLQQKVPNLQATAIEQWEPSQRYIKERLGAEVVDVDINDDWPVELTGKFDLVILRHTLEHLEEPLKVLCQIARCLSDKGRLYLAVPNLMAARPGTHMRTDFLRPVHLHYFNPTTLGRLAARGGLVPVEFEGVGEIWGMFRRASGKAENSGVGDDDPNAIGYTEQRDLLAARIRQSWLNDRIALARMCVRWWIKGA